MYRLLCGWLLLGLTQAVHAQNTEWTAVNLAVTDAVVLPAYDRFAASTPPLLAASEQLCAAVTQDNLAAVQQAFGAAFAAWQGVQHLQFGPITYFNWNYRLQFWPDDNGTALRQLDALLAAADPAVLESVAFAQQSVGVQGFPALERLLFADDSLGTLQKQPYHCAVVRAIASNVNDISTAVAARWRDEFRTTVANADERGFFESAEDATIDYLKAVVESVRRVQQQKLAAVLGENRAAARSRRAEAWRSDLSVPALRNNVVALQALLREGSPALSSVFLPDDLPAIDSAFATLQQDLAAVPDSMNAALADEAGYAALQRVHADLDALFELLEAAVKKTDLYLGFNSLDGD